MSRTHLGRSGWMLQRSHVDLLDDAVETVRLSSVEIHRTRVFFDETRMVTLHRQIPQDPLWTGVTLAAVGALVSVPFLFGDVVVALVAGILLATPGAVMALIALLRRSVVLTIQGPRTQARVVAVFSQHRIEQAHRHVAAPVAAAQAAPAAEAATPPA